MAFVSQDVTAALEDGLALLGVRRLVLAIHDASFPSTPDEDIGRGSPYGLGARDLLGLARALGFGALQLGPQGDTSRSNPSPYDGALFTRSPLSIAVSTLREDPVWEALCAGVDAADAPTSPATQTNGSSDRVRYDTAWRRAHDVLATLHGRFRGAPTLHGALAARFAAFRACHAATLTRDGDFEALAATHGTDDWRRWPTLDQALYRSPSPGMNADVDAAADARRRRLRVERASDVERHAFGQFILGEQHARLRRTLTGPAGGGAPMVLYGDLQIGISHRDVWSRRDRFLPDYAMGAPPSRTNPLGQPWGYPVLDPAQYDGVVGDRNATNGPIAGPALQLLLDRVDDFLEHFDGLRIDHPHGLVCPWAYRADAADPVVAVARGARLFCSPNLPDHPRLAAFAIPTEAQVSQDPSTPRYADDWVRDLDAGQVARYGRLFDALVARVAAAGRQPADVVCEVLSTWPRPLRAVMERHGLGRFCVTQKADLTRADDVYRSENVSARDWIMVGNHDTPPVWLLVEAWHGTAAGAERAAHLTTRLMPLPAMRPRFARWLAADPRNLAQGMFAELFASRAGNVSVFFADLFGLKAVYNRPGVIDPDNWTLRLPADFERGYRDRLRQGAACNVPLALALGLMSRQDATGDADARRTGTQLTRRLFTTAGELTPVLNGELAAIVGEVLRDR